MTNEIDQMNGVPGIETFHELPLVVAIGKQSNVPGKRLEYAREASGFASQAFEVMTQVCVERFL